MKKLIYIAILMFSPGSSSYAQYVRFPRSGAIAFEKTINMYAVMQKMSDNQTGFPDDYRKNKPQFKTYQSTLLFAEDKTLFTPEVAAAENNSFGMILTPDQPNTIYSDLSASKYINQKKVFEETFLVSDSLRRINWKITSELREIAGYQCRRANAIIMDSVYVVAFYTDQIPVSGGPESFQGLPGMILGVALPHEHITWFAKSVTDKSILSSELRAPVAGKPVNYKDLSKTIANVLKNWGSHARSALNLLLL
jgi:GLPGLI family protein